MENRPLTRRIHLNPTIRSVGSPAGPTSETGAFEREIWRGLQQQQARPRHRAALLVERARWAECGDEIAQLAPLRMVGQKRFGGAERAGLLGIVDDDEATRPQQARAHLGIESHEFKPVRAVDEDKVDGCCGLQQLRE